MTRELRAFLVASGVLGILAIASLSIVVTILYRSAWDGIRFRQEPVGDKPVWIEVDEHSPAAKAGMRSGELLLGINRRSPREAGATRLFTGEPRLYVVGRVEEKLGKPEITERREVTVTPRRLIESRFFVISLISGSLLAAFLFGLGTLVHYRKLGDARARLFHWLCGFLGILAVSPSGERLVATAVQDPLLVVLMIFWVFSLLVLIPAMGFHFCLIFPRPRPLVEKKPALIPALYLIPGSFALLFLISVGDTPAGHEPPARALVGVVGFITMGVIYFILACVNLIKAYRQSSLEEKRQIRWPVWGIVVGMVASILLPTIMNTRFSSEEGMNEVQFGIDPRGLMIIPITFAFAILKRNLLGIDTLIKKTIAYSALSVTLILVYIGLVAILGRLFVASSGLQNETVTIISTLVIAGVFIPLKNKIQRVVDQRFFREPYQHAEALRVVSEEIVAASTTGLLFQRVSDHLCDTLRARSVVIFSREPFMPFFNVSAQAGLMDLDVRDTTISSTSSLADLSSILRAAAGSLSDEDSATIQRTQTSLIVPVRVTGELVALIGIGSKLSDEDFNARDEEFLLDVARQLAVGIENQRLRTLREAESEWRTLDRHSRLIFAAFTRMTTEQLDSKDALIDGLKQMFLASGINVSETQIAVGVQRLLDRSTVILRNERFEIGDTRFLALPDVRRPLPGLANELKQRIGAYELIEKIGSGGMGEVFRAVNVHDGSFAAIKLLPELETSKEEARRRLEREGAVVSSLAHPNVVRLLARGEHDGRIYLAMELLEGDTLAEAIRRPGWSRLAAYQVAVEVASALAALHQAGVVHRDVKSSNVMLTRSGRAVLLDFGIARSAGTTSITTHQRVLGSLPYISPEQLRGESVDSRADVWSFGIVMTEIFTGRRPWKSHDSTNLALEILSTRPEVPDAPVPPQLTSLINRMIDPNPAWRVRDGNDVLRELSQMATLFLTEDGSRSAAFAVSAVETITLVKPPPSS